MWGGLLNLIKKEKRKKKKDWYGHFYGDVVPLGICHIKYKQKSVTYNLYYITLIFYYQNQTGRVIYLLNPYFVILLIECVCERGEFIRV
jgi:hypothetical protein